MSVAKIFKNGRSQAIRLPKEFRLRGAEVHVKKVPGGILVTERDPWDVCREACAEISPEFLATVERREQPPVQRRDMSDVSE